MTTPDPHAPLSPGDVATWTETRYVAQDGTGYDFDPHNGPCDCRREQRNVYAGPWLQAGGWADSDSGGQADRWRQTWTSHNPTHRLWSELRGSRAGDPDAQAGYDRAQADHHNREDQK